MDRLSAALGHRRAGAGVRADPAGTCTGASNCWAPAGRQRRSTGTAGLSFADAVDRTAPSVVSIYTQSVELQEVSPQLQRILGRQYVARSRRDMGSGVLVSSDGYILTNHHVVSQVQNIQVALWDGRFAAAEVVGADPATDLAVLKITWTACRRRRWRWTGRCASVTWCWPSATHWA